MLVWRMEQLQLWLHWRDDEGDDLGLGDEAHEHGMVSMKT